MFKKFAQISVNSRIKFFVKTSPLLLQEVKCIGRWGLPQRHSPRKPLERSVQNKVQLEFGDLLFTLQA
jgi:hypothetical protein